MALSRSYDQTRAPSAEIVTRARRLIRAHARRFVRFGLVGGTGVLVNLAVLVLLVELFGLAPLLAAAVATETAILSNFALNDAWTFRDARSGSRWHVRAARYNIYALGGLAISLAVLVVLTGWLGMHYLAANLVAIGVATSWIYVTNARWTWQARGMAPARDGRSS